MKDLFYDFSQSLREETLSIKWKVTVFGMETLVLIIIFKMGEECHMFCGLVLFWCILFFFIVNQNMK